MRKKGLLGLLGIIGLILVLVILPFTAACGPAAPEKTKIEIFGGRPADSSTVLTFALASFINEDSDWLKASAIPTGGMADGQKILVEEPERRSSTIVMGATILADIYLADTGWYPLFMTRYQAPLQLWVSYDPNIKTPEDFAGKTIGVPREIYPYWDVFKGVLARAGVLDTVKVIHSGLTGNANVLIDGSADVTFTLFSNIHPEIKPESYQEKMGVRGDLYYVDLGKDKINDSCAELGLPPMAEEIPAGAIGPAQTTPIYAVQFSYWWGAGLEMDDDIVSEVARIAYERGLTGDFANYHGSGGFLVPALMSYGDWVVPAEIAEWYHPAALELYREIGVPGL